MRRNKRASQLEKSLPISSRWLCSSSWNSFSGRQVLGLQRADELEHVLVGDHVGRRRRQPAEQVVDDGALQLAAFGRQVGDAVGRVGDDLGRRLAAVALQVERLLEQRIEGGGDEQVEVGDLRQLPQRQRRLELHFAQDRAQPRVGFFAPAALAEVSSTSHR